MRTGKIGLNSFLRWRNVPDIPSDLCRCGGAPETVCHIVTDCPLYEAAAAALRARVASPLRTSKDLALVLRDPETAGAVARWLLRTGRLTEFRVAMELGGVSYEKPKRNRREYAGRRHRCRNVREIPTEAAAAAAAEDRRNIDG